jgi:hypothetical protein
VLTEVRTVLLGVSQVVGLKIAAENCRRYGVALWWLRRMSIPNRT